MTTLERRPSPSQSHGYHRAVRLVARWTAFYTRGLEQAVVADRRDEMASDLWEQGADADARGASGARTELAILWRAARGVVADLSWRQQAMQGQPSGPELRGWVGRGSFVVAVSLSALVLTYALLALGRLAGNAAHALPLASPTTMTSLGGGTILLVCGMLLLLRRATRWLGSTWIAVLAPAVLFFATRAVIDVSATFQWFYDGMIAFGPAEWRLFAAFLLGALFLFFLSLAIAWFPSRATAARPGSGLR